MKPITRFIPILSVALLLLGCQTLDTAKVLDLVASRAYGAVKLAVAADLSANPGHRGAYVAGKLALDGMLASTNFTSVQLEAVLGKLPIKEFQGTDGALVLAGVMFVYDFATMFAYQVESVPAVVKLGTAVRDGLDAALNATAATAMSLRAASGPTPAPPPTKLTPKKIIRI